MSDSFSLIVDRLTTHLGVDNAAVEPGVTFADLALDSLALLDLAAALEDQLRIRPPYLEPTTTLGEAAAHLDATVSAP
jgi:acyl carrier protein